MKSTFADRLKEGLPRVREGVAAAAARDGRVAGDVTLVAVTKGHPVAAAEAARDAGLRDLGENRVEALTSKASTLHGAEIRWHMIGHLQRRQAKDMGRVAHLIHSVDSVRLATRLSGLTVANEADMRILIQVNTSGEATKGGLVPSEAPDVVGEILELPGLVVQGLMTMAPWGAEERVLRRTFQGVRRIQEALESLTGYAGRELSMGMTNDFVVAIEEGSTMIRVGTALFGERQG